MLSKILFLVVSLLFVSYTLKIITPHHLLQPFANNIMLRASKGISQNSFIRLLRFASTDKNIVNTWNSREPFTAGQESKIRDYIVRDKEISSELLSTFQLRTGYSWVANLTDATKKEIVNVSLNFPVGQMLDNGTLAGLIKELRKNKEIDQRFNDSLTNSTEENSKTEPNEEVRGGDDELVSEGISEQSQIDIMKDSEQISDNYYEYYDWNKKDEESYNEFWGDETNGYYNQDVDGNEQLNSEEGGQYGEDEQNIDGQSNNTNSTGQSQNRDQISEGKENDDDIVSEEIEEESQFDVMNYSQESNDKYYENYDWTRKDDQEYNDNWLKEEVGEEEGNDWPEEQHQLQLIEDGHSQDVSAFEDENDLDEDSETVTSS